MRNQSIKERSLDKRRDLQFHILVDWNNGKLTGDECIERIVELEKLVFLDKNIIHGDTTNGPTQP